MNITCLDTQKDWTDSIDNCDLVDFTFDSETEFEMEEIDSEFKAYLLGWIAGNGRIVDDSIRIKINFDEDARNFQKVFSCENGELKISKKVCYDACRILKSEDPNSFEFPNSISLKWPFIRGLLDASGGISQKECFISLDSPAMKIGVSDFCKIKCSVTAYCITFRGTNSLDFLSKIYDNSSPEIRSERNFRSYIKYACPWSNKLPVCSFMKTREDAISPTKNFLSDEGYDLWIVDVDHVVSKRVTRFDTFIKVQPELGWHVEILPRSSLSNTGYMLANSIGLIDPSFSGSLKIALIKVDEDAPELKLPFKAVQAVLRQNVHYLMQESNEIYETQRGEKGFGSTN
jgi:dUTP pyrophosphatase